MDLPSATDPLRLPCGCLIDMSIDEEGERVFMIIACSKGLNCHYVKYCYNEAHRQGKEFKEIIVK